MLSCGKNVAAGAFTRFWCWTRARPKTSLAVAALFMVVAGWSGVQSAGFGFYTSARLAFDEDRLDDARRQIERCLRCWPASPKAHLLAARIERLSGSFDEAARLLKECKRLEGITETTQLEFVLLRAQDGQLAEVEKSLRDLVSSGHAESISILTALANAYMEDGRYQSAQACLTELLKRSPQDLRGLRWRGLLRERMRDIPGAADDYRSLLARAPDRWKVRLRLLDILLSSGNTREATVHADTLRASHWEVPEVRLAVARCQVLSGEPAQARTILDALIAGQPKLALALYYRGRIENDGPLAAERWLRRALEAEPTLHEARFALYFNLQGQGKTAEANSQLATYRSLEDRAGKLKEVLTLLERRPKDPELLGRAGELLLQAGNDDAGQQFLHKALEADEHYRKAHEILGGYFESKKEADKASYHLHRAGKP